MLDACALVAVVVVFVAVAVGAAVGVDFAVDVAAAFAAAGFGVIFAYANVSSHYSEVLLLLVFQTIYLSWCDFTNRLLLRRYFCFFR